jgi:hypothetical protein
MHNYTQKELMSEGFWSDFVAPKAAGAWQLGKEIGKVVLPKTSENIGKVVQGTRDAAQRVDQAFTKMSDRVKFWLDENGIVPIKGEPIKKIKDFPDGNKHFAVKVAEKGVDPDTGDAIPARKFKYPSAIILYNRKDNTFKWVTKPRMDQLITVRDPNNPRRTVYDYWDARANVGDNSVGRNGR